MEPVNSERSRPARYSIPLPNMRRGNVVGLGKILGQMTSAVGVLPCEGCEGRAKALDRLVEFRGKRGYGG